LGRRGSLAGPKDVSMPELIPHAPDNPEFARVIELRQIRELDAFPFDIAPTDAEARAIAALLDLQGLRKVRFAGRLTPLARGGWRLDARLGATVVQSCVVTLDPVTTRIDQPVRRLWLADDAPRTAEILVDPEEDDELEPLGDRIDLGRVALEALALALPAYPRKPGAGLPAGAAEEAADLDAEPELKPFAGLAALRAKMGEGS
jgi:uncharacterized metal-binding protein YceD (DUF177 family)